MRLVGDESIDDQVSNLLIVVEDQGFGWGFVMMMMHLMI